MTKVVGLFAIVIFSINVMANTEEANPLPEACVINFERKDHSFSLALDSQLSSFAGLIRVVNGAVPMDIIKCIEDGAGAITIIAHAGDFNSKKQYLAPLTYLKEIKGQTRTELLRNSKNIIFNNQLIYSIKLIENYFWKSILLRPVALRKINFVSCLPEMVQSYYPELSDLKKQGVEINFAPKNRIASFFLGKEVTSPDYDWIRKELFLY
jgi:hypothetical protein